MYDAILECRSAEQCYRHHMHVIEPAADLPRILHNEITREVRFEPILVLERIMLLRVGNASAFKPALAIIAVANNNELFFIIKKIKLISCEVFFFFVKFFYY